MGQFPILWKASKPLDSVKWLRYRLYHNWAGNGFREARSLELFVAVAVVVDTNLLLII